MGKFNRSVSMVKICMCLYSIRSTMCCLTHNFCDTKNCSYNLFNIDFHELPWQSVSWTVFFFSSKVLISFVRFSVLVWYSFFLFHLYVKRENWSVWCKKTASHIYLYTFCVQVKCYKKRRKKKHHPILLIHSIRCSSWEFQFCYNWKLFLNFCSKLQGLNCIFVVNMNEKKTTFQEYSWWNFMSVLWKRFALK